MFRVVMAVEDAEGEPAPVVDKRPRAKALTRNLHPSRVAAGVTIARILHEAIASKSNFRRVASALGISHSIVGRWCDRREPVDMTIRDLVALLRRGERPLYLHVLLRLRELAGDDEPPSPSGADLVRRDVTPANDNALPLDGAPRVLGKAA